MYFKFYFYFYFKYVIRYEGCHMHKIVSATFEIMRFSVIVLFNKLCIVVKNFMSKNICGN